jgi:hypothetical protein
MSCSPYAASGSLYYFSKAFMKCLECVRYDVQCDGNFSINDFDRLHAEQEKLKRARQDALKRAAKDIITVITLKRHIKALRKAKGRMIKREARSLKELDLEEEW